MPPTATPNSSCPVAPEADPPKYSDTQTWERVMAAVENHWDSTRPKSWVVNNKKYAKPNIVFEWRSYSLENRLQGNKHTPAWRARMEVRAENIPRLMRKGFHVSSQNVCMGSSWIVLNDRSPRPKEMFCGLGWSHTQVIKLKQKGEHPEWTGTLYVATKSQTVMADFDFSWLQQDKLRKVTALNWEYQLVYRWDFFRPDAHFNTIYRGMALTGWWPWPKTDTKPQIVAGIETREKDAGGMEA
ncbi:unnamed protein product [Clonostachys rosea]|uniref:Uncharacterized protein n=1 Tax=Bionectria ochroleuca TaxID=29856 RepID=A0ABY6UL25_BIOOC|nr:unnamed protein product [Clonostachys rosea]